jgi:transglutaminase-like putative cysteine protease
MLKAGWLAFFLAIISFISAKAANCDVIKYSTTIDILNNRYIQTDTVIIRINSRAGEDYADISINYYRDNPVTNLNAWITNGNGKIVRYLKNKEISESNTVSSTFYTDYFTKKFILKHNEYPYYITYIYQTTVKQYLSIANWHPVIALDVPTIEATLTFRQPDDFKVNIIQNNINNPEIISASGIIIQRWTATYDGTLRREVYSPDPWDYLPGVHIVPVQFHYGLPGSMESWQSFGIWQTKLIEGLDELPASEKELVKSEILNISEKKEIVKTLYHYLQDHTRYVNVQIGIGGLKPYPASYVAQNKFGDCKALSVFMKALLKFSGLESHYVLVNAGESTPMFYPDIPHLQFNHAMIAVPLENDTVWLENTSNWLPFGYHGIFTQNRTGLLIDGDNSKLVKIPPLQPDQTTCSRKIFYNIVESGGTNVRTVFTYKGAAFETLNNLLINYTTEDQNEIIHNFLPFPAFDLVDWKMIKNDRDNECITLTATLETNQIVNPIGDQYYFSFQQSDIPDFEQPSSRILPLRIPYPLISCDTLVYKLPAGRNIIQFPDETYIKSKYGSYSISFVNKGKSIEIHKQFKLNPILVEPQEYSEFYSFIASIKTSEKLKILFR